MAGDGVVVLVAGLGAVWAAWIGRPRTGWKYMLRVRRGEFDDLPMDEVPRPEASSWRRYSGSERVNFYGAMLFGVLGIVLVVVGIILIAIDVGGP